MHCIFRILKLMARSANTSGIALCRALICITLSGFASNTIATQPLTEKNILIIYQKSQGFSQQLLQNLQQSISKAGHHVHLKTLSTDTLKTLKTTKYSLIIAIGSKTTKQLLHKKIKTPIFSVLMPRHLASKLRKLYPDKNNWSYLLLDQPIRRQLELIASITGKHQKVGALTGPYTMELKKTLTQSAKAAGRTLITESITNADQLTPSLKVLSRKADILLTLPDPVIYNKKTIRGILLLSYRKKLPIIGFSQAYVKAGAIAAIYSEPYQISEQATSIILDFFKSRRFNLKKYQPDDFSVALNRKVARSLGINLPEKAVIITAIKNTEKNNRDGTAQ